MGRLSEYDKIEQVILRGDDVVLLECDRGHRWFEGQGRKEGPSEWTGGVVLEICSGCGLPGFPVTSNDQA